MSYLKLLYPNGRIGRLEFILFYTPLISITYYCLFIMILVFFPCVLDDFLTTIKHVPYISIAALVISHYFLGGLNLWLLPGLFIICLFLSCLVAVKRFHDFNASGWWLVIGLFPYGIFVIWAAMIFIPGSRSTNDYDLYEESLAI